MHTFKLQLHRISGKKFGEYGLGGAKLPGCGGYRESIFQIACVWLVRHEHLTQWPAVSFVILRLAAAGGDRFSSNQKASTRWPSNKDRPLGDLGLLPVCRQVVGRIG
jgi:hypothetical protein